MYHLDLESDTKTSFGSDRREYNAFYITRFTYACTKYKKSRKEDMRIQRPLCCEKARDTVYTAHNGS